MYKFCTHLPKNMHLFLKNRISFNIKAPPLGVMLFSIGWFGITRSFLCLYSTLMVCQEHSHSLLSLLDKSLMHLCMLFAHLPSLVFQHVSAYNRRLSFGACLRFLAHTFAEPPSMADAQLRRLFAPMLLVGLLALHHRRLLRLLLLYLP